MAVPQARVSTGWLTALLLLLALPALGAQAKAGVEAQRLERLVKLAELWGEVKFLHPGLATRELDWDAALLEALPKVEAATDSSAYRAAVAGMLVRLGDPVTRVQQARDTLPPLAASAHPFRRWERGDTLVLRLASLGGSGSLEALQSEVEGLKADVARAQRVVMDARLRALPGGASEVFGARSAFSIVLSFLLDAPLAVPGERHVFHSGYAAPNGFPSSGGYHSGFVSEAEEVLPARRAPRSQRLTFVVDARSPSLSALMALRSAGRADVVAEGEVSDEAVVQTRELDLGEGVSAQVRITELGVALAFDAQLPERGGTALRDAALERSLQLSARPLRRAKQLPGAVLPPARRPPEKTYADAPLPDRAQRQLAAIRLWTVIRLFYPYLALLDAPWDAALAQHLPHFEAAASAEEYVRAVLELAGRIQDAHTNVSGHPALAKWLPEAGVPIEVLELQGKPVLVAERFPGAAPGLPVGAVIETVDGEPIARRIERLAPFVPAATAAHQRYLLLRLALAGPRSSVAVLGVREEGGRRTEVKVTRGARPAPGTPSPAAYRVLPGKVGYASLLLLQPGEVDAMFAALKDTRALVLDLRGYPRGTFTLLAPYLNTRGAKVAALFERPLVSGRPQPERLKFAQVPPAAGPGLYRGRVLVLIDERAISQAEHTGLWLEALTDVTFVGSPTAGTNGDVTAVRLPGGLTVSFTGHDVRHADGRQLQRRGLQPHVPVRPTAAGLRAGRDEVLEQALKQLEAPRGAASAAP